MSHFQHPCKCMSCSLHWLVCSEHEDWGASDETTKDPICPECGSNVIMRWAPHKVEQFIFQSVPGPDRRAILAIGHLGGNPGGS